MLFFPHVPDFIWPSQLWITELSYSLQMTAGFPTSQGGFHSGYFCFAFWKCFCSATSGIEPEWHWWFQWLLFPTIVKKHFNNKWSEGYLIDDHWKAISLLMQVKLLFLWAWNNEIKILDKDCLFVLVNVQFLCGTMYLKYYKYEISNVHLKW